MSAAEAMVKSGLINHGWTYINIDDFWQVHRESNDPTLNGPARDAAGRIQPNPRFPDMKGLADYVHSPVLKVGLSIARTVDLWRLRGQLWPRTSRCRILRRVGFDYLKYDWCSYNPVLESHRGAATPGMENFPVGAGCRPRIAPNSRGLTKSCRTPSPNNRGTFSTAFASMAWAMSGNGELKSAATVGARPATSWIPAQSGGHRFQPGGQGEVCRAGALQRSRHVDRWERG